MSIVFREFKYFWKQFVGLVIAVIGLTTTAMGLPYLMQALIDYSIPEEDYMSVVVVCGFMLLLVGIELLSGLFTANLAARVAMGVSRNLRGKVFHKVQGFSEAEIDAFSTSSLITRTCTDIQQIQLFLALCLSIAMMAPIMCIVGMIMAISTSPDLSAILIFSIPMLAIALVIIGRIAIPLSNRIQKKLDRINMVIREKLTGARVIRAFGTTKFEEGRFDKINVEYTKMNKKMMIVVAAMLPVIVLILALTVAALMYIACRSDYTAGIQYTTGEVMAIISYIINIMAAVILLTIVFLLLPRAAACAKRTKEVLQSENLIKDALDPKNNPDKRGYLEFKNVSFTYVGASKPAIKDLSFTSAPGETTAIIGGTGMGKSTIINMIPRLYDVSEGSILVDGVDVRDYKLDELRKKIGFVPQKACLFKGTIDSNIMFGDKEATEDAVEEAIQIAQSYDFVMEKEKGFEEPVAQGGQNFSGGQKQRLCIARAIVRKPEIYIFDDSFSALDFKTDKTLRHALKDKTKDATTVIVAQRVSTILEADRIICIDRGEVKGIGTHEELLKSCDVYKEIVESQMSKSEVA
ncbi:MAG: ABC transporter ATP-binding protein [Coriobacteriia bacterium]|nr:ABC transporter ATP-binding protein [Coriobacteriia bacterium]